jgi:tetratricopeptide (TPR) repeat protein/predicted Ser/Thr protein kinase
VGTPANGQGNVGTASTQISPGDSFSDVDSVIGEFVAGLAGAPVAPRFEAGAVVAGHFEIVRKLGEGGMGVVFLARDRRLDREVAIKLVGRRSAVATARLEREAQAMAQLSHPNVVTVHEVGQHDGAVYIAMEYVDGATLRVWQASEARTWRQIVEVYVQAARGLAAAHATGFVHRDFKPDNVLLGLDGRARVADFGLARTLGSVEVSRERVDRDLPIATHPSLTASDAVLGTPGYMAPEQFNSAVPLGPRVDQFAFGVALHEALVGVRPFGDIPNWVASAGDRVAIPANREVPRWLRRVLGRLVALEPTERYPDMRTVADALEHGLGLARARRRWALGLVGAGAAVAIGVGVGTSSRPTPCSDAAAAAAAMWTPARREALAAAFTQDGESAARTWTAVDALVETWVAQWTEVRVAGCEATRVDGSQSEALLDRQVACLDGRLDRVTAVLDVLPHSQAQRARVDELAADLPDVAICSDTEYLLARVAPPEDPAVRDAVAELALRFEQVDIRFGTDDFAGLAAEVRGLVASADALGWDPARARAKWLLGRVGMVEGERDAASTLMREAYFLARGAGDDESASHIALSLGYLDGMLRNEPESAELWLQHAEADVRRGAAPPRIRINVEVTRAQALLAAGDADAAVVVMEQAMAHSDALNVSRLDRLFLEYELAAALDAASQHTEALALYDRMIEDVAALLGPRSRRAGMLYNNRGLARYYVQDLTGAIEDLRLALAIEAEVGTSEASRAPGRLNLALALAANGAYDEAVPQLEQLRTWWKTHPEAIADDALVTKALAWVELRRGNLERAASLAAEALASARRALDPDHPEVAASETLVGDIALAQGAVSAAIEPLEAAQRIWAAPANAGNPASIDTINSLAEARLRSGRLDDALALAESALAVAAAGEVSDGSRGTAYFVRARVREAKGDTAAATADARTALDLLEGPLTTRERADVEAWLRR